MLLGVVAVYIALTRDMWALASLPFIALGSICSAPNLNLADGFLAIVSALIGLAVAKWLFQPLGIAIFAGSVTGYYGGAIEKRVRMHPAPEATKPEDAQPEVGQVSSEAAPSASPDDTCPT